jgi:hypothetical protein
MVIQSTAMDTMHLGQARQVHHVDLDDEPTPNHDQPAVRGHEPRQRG